MRRGRYLRRDAHDPGGWPRQPFGEADLLLDAPRRIGSTAAHTRPASLTFTGTRRKGAVCEADAGSWLGAGFLHVGGVDIAVGPRLHSRRTDESGQGRSRPPHGRARRTPVVESAAVAVASCTSRGAGDRALRERDGAPAGTHALPVT